MNHSLFQLERHVTDAIERIASDRAGCGDPFARGERAPASVGAIRRRLGAVLIKLGERVGGPPEPARRPAAPLPMHTPTFGF